MPYLSRKYEGPVYTQSPISLTSHHLLILTVSPTHPLDVRDMAYDSVEYEKLLQTDEQLEEEVGVPASRREGMPFLTHGPFSNA